MMPGKTTDSYNSPVRDCFAGITDEQWRGDEPYFVGGLWVLDGKTEYGKGYSCYYGSGEIAFGVVAKGEISVGDDVVFHIFGIGNPHLRCRIGYKVFDSDKDAGVLFDANFKKYLVREPFQSDFGRKFIAQIKKALYYTLDI